MQQDISVTEDPPARRAESSRRWLGWPAGDWMLGAFLAIAWIARYVRRYGLDPAVPPNWLHWFDQDKYIRSAEALASGVLAPDAHWYPLGYPITGAATFWLMPGSPYLITNALLFAMTGVAFRRAIRPFGIGAAMAAVIFLLTTIGTVKLLWLVPWSTTLSAALIWWLLALTIETLWPTAGASQAGQPPRGRLVALGMLAGALPLSRPTDALVGAIVLGIIACVLWRQRRLTVQGMAWIAAGALALILPNLLLHLAIWGARPSPYGVASANMGFVFGDLGWKSYVLLITPQPWYPNCLSLIERLPWVLPGAAGLTVAAVMMDRPARLALGLMALVAIPASILSLAYVDLNPPGLWFFNNAHYFKWLFPLFGAGVWLWLLSFRSRRGAVVAVGALLLWLAPACFRLIPRSVADGQPARMLRFHGSTTRIWQEAYFAPATITDSRGKLHNIGEFHQVPDDAGERALAITRLFAAHPRRDDPGETPSLAHAQPPYARYAVRVSLGLPCWIERAACQLPKR